MEQESLSVHQCWITTANNVVYPLQLFSIQCPIYGTALWNELPVHRTFEILPHTEHCLRLKTPSLRLGTWSKSLFPGVRITKKYPLFIIRDDSPPKPVVSWVAKQFCAQGHRLLRLSGSQIMGNHSRLPGAKVDADAERHGARALCDAPQAVRRPGRALMAAPAHDRCAPASARTECRTRVGNRLHRFHVTYCIFNGC